MKAGILSALLVLSMNVPALAQAGLEPAFRFPTSPLMDEPAFHQIAAIWLLPGGEEVLVFDHLRTTVRVFDRGGGLLREFGGRGDAPGRISGLAFIAAPVGSRVYVSDSGTRRVTWFDLDGGNVSTVPFPARDEGELRRVDSFRPLRHGLWLVRSTARFLAGDPGEPDQLIHFLVIDGRGRLVDEVGRFHSGWGWAGPAERPLAGSTTDLFGVGGMSAVGGDSLIVVAEAYRGVVRWYEVGRGGPALSRTRDLGLAPRPAVSRSRIPAGHVRFDPAYEAQFDWMMVAENGDVWLKHRTAEVRDPGHREQYTVVPFDPAAPARQVTLPADFRLRSVSGALLLGIHLDEYSVQAVAAFRMR
jgi:hypothetical protein